MISLWGRQGYSFSLSCFFNFFYLIMKMSWSKTLILVWNCSECHMTDAQSYSVLPNTWRRDCHSESLVTKIIRALLVKFHVFHNFCSLFFFIFVALDPHLCLLVSFFPCSSLFLADIRSVAQAPASVVFFVLTCLETHVPTFYCCLPVLFAWFLLSHVKKAKATFYKRSN